MRHAFGVVGDVVERDPEDVLDELLFGFFGTQLLHVVARLGIADLVESDAESVDVLARRSGSDRDVLYRYLRALASLGVFVEVEEQQFAQTPASRLLRRDSGLGWHDFAVVYGNVYRAFAEALPAAREGTNMFERATGSGWWDWLAERPEDSAAFNRAMQAGAQARLATLTGFPWHEVETVVDVGGGNGTLVLGLLEQHSHLRGVVFDLPEVASAASAKVATAALGDRCAVEAGSFFERVPEGADVYVLAKILHDWDDPAALEILQRVRAAAAPGANLLVLDSVLTAETSSQRTKLLDLVMLALVNGRERTSSEWTQLLTAGGWTVTSLQNGLIQAHPAPR
jgi:O-methyltransferase